MEVDSHSRRSASGGSKKELMATTSGKQQQYNLNRSDNTVTTVESDWETEFTTSGITVSLNPWSLYQALRHARVVTVEPVVFLYYFGMYLMYPLTQEYYLARYSLQTLENTSYPFANQTMCIDGMVVERYTGKNDTSSALASKSALVYMYRELATLLVGLVATLVMGPLSDRFGRKPVMLLAASGACLQGVASIFLVRFKGDLHYFVLVGAVEGMFGYFMGLMMASFAYVSDISSGKWRTVRLGVVQAMVSMSSILALKVGTKWSDTLQCGLLPPLYLFVACNVAILLYVVLFLPESLTSEERRRKNADKPGGARALVRGLGIFFCCIRKYTTWKLWCALLALGTALFVMESPVVILFFYFRDLEWSSKRSENYQTVSMASHASALIFLLPFLAAIKVPDSLMALIGLVATICANFLMGFTTSKYLLFTIVSFQGIEALTVTALRGYMSKLVHVEDQGAIFSVTESLESLISMLSYVYINTLPLLMHRGLSSNYLFVIVAAMGFIPMPFICVLLIAWCRMKYANRRRMGQGPNFYDRLREEEKEEKEEGERGADQQYQQPPPPYSASNINR